MPTIFDSKIGYCILTHPSYVFAVVFDSAQATVSEGSAVYLLDRLLCFSVEVDAIYSK